MEVKSFSPNMLGRRKIRNPASNIFLCNYKKIRRKFN
jgi:hypothetical protein